MRSCGKRHSQSSPIRNNVEISYHLYMGRPMAKIRKAAHLALGVLTVWITAGVWYSRPLTPAELLDGDPPGPLPGLALGAP